jgi:predicted aspartyl protease
MPTVPFEIPSAAAPLVIMQGELNGYPARVLLDTGNSAPFAVLVSPAVAETASITPTSANGSAGSAIGAGAVSIRSATLKSFQLGDVGLTDINAGITDVPDHVSKALERPVDAIVGWSFLRTRTIRIDYPARHIDLNATPGASGFAIGFTVSPKRRLITVEARINGQGPFTLAVDTGAGATLISREAAERAGVTSRGDGVTMKGGGGADATPATRGSSSILTLGGVTYESVRPVIVDFLPRISEAAGAQLDGVVGADVLSRGRLTIDFPRSMLWLDDQ